MTHTDDILIEKFRRILFCRNFSFKRHFKSILFYKYNYFLKICIIIYSYKIFLMSFIFILLLQICKLTKSLSLNIVNIINIFSNISTISDDCQCRKTHLLSTSLLSATLSNENHHQHHNHNYRHQEKKSKIFLLQ